MIYFGRNAWSGREICPSGWIFTHLVYMWQTPGIKPPKSHIRVWSCYQSVMKAMSKVSTHSRRSRLVHEYTDYWVSVTVHHHNKFRIWWSQYKHGNGTQSTEKELEIMNRFSVSPPQSPCPECTITTHGSSALVTRTLLLLLLHRLLESWAYMRPELRANCQDRNSVLVTISHTNRQLYKH